MKTLLNKCFGWMIESNRGYHICAGYIIGAIFGIIPVIIAALSVEFKDWQWNGGKGWPVTKNGFDWLDVAATIIGGLLGLLIALPCHGRFEYSLLTGFF